MSRNRDDESEAFRAAMHDVKPLGRDAVVIETPKPQPKARFRRADERSVLEESLRGPLDPDVLQSGEQLNYRRDGVRRTVLRDLRRGRFTVEGELDLHGMTSPTARLALAAFLNESLDHGRRCVRVVHGKGRGSGQRGPVLKGKVDRWLRQRGDVLAFTSTPPVDGGTGAVYVLLARRLPAAP